MSIWLEEDYKIQVTEVGTEKNGNKLSCFDIWEDPKYIPNRFRMVVLTGNTDTGPQTYRIVDYNYRGLLVTVQQEGKKPIAVDANQLAFTDWSYAQD